MIHQEVERRNEEEQPILGDIFSSFVEEGVM